MTTSAETTLSAAVEFDFGDLELGELTVTNMRDTSAMPESGASTLGGPSSCSCSCCIKPD